MTARAIVALAGWLLGCSGDGARRSADGAGSGAGVGSTVAGSATGADSSTVSSSSVELSDTINSRPGTQPHPARPSGSGGAASAGGATDDTLRGVIAVVGSEPATTVTLRPSDGGPSRTLVGPSVSALRTLSGADVWLRATARSGEAVVVSRFAVRSVDGVPAVDGVLELRGADLVLHTVEGSRLRIVAPPPALRDRVGARVWIAGPLHRSPAAYGVIEERVVR